MAYDSSYNPTPLEQALEAIMNRRKITIGLPAPSCSDRRFPLTPEAAGLLAGRGFLVKMEKDAAQSIRYTNMRYQQQGVEIVDRSEAMRCDMVISFSPFTTLQARMLKKGALLLTLFDSVAHDSDVIRLLLHNHVIALALDLVLDDLGHKPFADILAEIAGRASVVLASSLLTDSDRGKGILLGGVAGIVPCEVMVMGSGIDACAAARSAIGLGAMVRMFDNDTYRLRAAIRELGPGVMGSAMHPRVMLNALRSADVVIATEIRPVHVITAEAIDEMKSGVVVFDLTKRTNPVFPSMEYVDLGIGNADLHLPSKVCYINPGNAVPRTEAMAMSNALMTLLTEIFTCDGLTNALMLNSGLQAAALTFLGKPVNQHVANLVGMRAVDIKLILQFS